MAAAGGVPVVAAGGIATGQQVAATLGSPVQRLLARDSVVSAFEHGVGPVLGSAAGQAVGLVTAERSVASVVDRLRAEMVAALSRCLLSFVPPTPDNCLFCRGSAGP